MCQTRDIMMLKKLDEKAQTNQMILFLFIMLISMFIFGDPGRRVAIAEAMNSALFPTLGFNGAYVLLTVFLSGCLVTILSSFFTNLPTANKDTIFNLEKKYPTLYSRAQFSVFSICSSDMKASCIYLPGYCWY